MELDDAQIKNEETDINPEPRQPAPAKAFPRALSDGSRDETPTPTYKHRWTVEQRLTLTMLAESYSNKWNELTKVFNHAHKSDLRRCGGLRVAVVNTQFNDMRRKIDAVAALRRVQATLSPYDRTSLVSPAVIEKKAEEVGIQLIARRPTDTSSRGNLTDDDAQGGQKRKRFDPYDDRRTDFLPDNPIRIAPGLQTLRDLPLTPKTPTKIDANQHYSLLTPPDSRERKIPRLITNKRLASIGFRAFTTASQGTYTPSLGIRAGGFLNCPKIPLAHDLEVSRYREEALHHITKHDHTRPSLFVSVTKNPMRALHMLLHAPDGEKSLILIDLKLADEKGNVERAYDLKLRTEFMYSAAGEYLIFGGVDPKAIISRIPLSDLLSHLPTIPDDDDPFRIKVLQAHGRLSKARGAIKRAVPPMTYSLGSAVGRLVGILGIPPQHFQSGVWAIVQDYKFYSAEGGKRIRWVENSAFKDGALQGYQAHQPHPLPSLLITSSHATAREIIQTDDSESDSALSSDSHASEQEGQDPVEVEDWIRKTQENQSSRQYYDVETSTWMTQDEELSEDFFVELKDFANNVDDEIGFGVLTKRAQDVSQNRHQDTNMTGLGGLQVQIDPVTEDPFTVPARNHLEESKFLDELCADVMHAHGDGALNSVTAEEERSIQSSYEFAWTGM